MNKRPMYRVTLCKVLGGSGRLGYPDLTCQIGTLRTSDVRKQL